MCSSGVGVAKADGTQSCSCEKYESMTLDISRTTVRIKGGKAPYSCKFYVDDKLPTIINNLNSNSFSTDGKVNWNAYCDIVEIQVECVDSSNHIVSDSASFWVTNACE